MTEEILSARAAIAQLRELHENSDNDHIHLLLYGRKLKTKNRDLIRLWLVFNAVESASKCFDIFADGREVRRIGPVIGRTWSEVAQSLTWFCVGPLCRVVLGCPVDGRPATHWETYVAELFSSLFDESGKPNTLARQLVKRAGPDDWERVFSVIAVFLDNGDLDYLSELLTAELQAADERDDPQELVFPLVVNCDNPMRPWVEYEGTQHPVKPEAAELFTLLVEHYPKTISVKEYLPDLRVQRIKDGLPDVLANLIDSGRGKPGTTLIFPPSKKPMAFESPSKTRK